MTDLFSGNFWSRDLDRSRFPMAGTEQNHRTQGASCAHAQSGSHTNSAQGLSTLSNLKTLSIQANKITSLEGLKDVPQLEELYISDNLLTSLEPLSNTPNLRILDVQNNPITSLRGVSCLSLIENLWATSCKLERFDELEKELGDKKELSEVYFEGNPLQKSNPVLYRNKVRLALPQVSKIDASKLSASSLSM